jgi:4-diphosphocytidyl-2-C-methyl-D-erythritol kinase
LILFPNCKINLGLRVAGKRADGYHDLETIFYPLPLKDAAELTCSQKMSGQDFELTISGLNVPGKTGNNLCYKAWQLLKQDFPSIVPVRMHLLKAIPIGAGLGGGSSDGAHTLLLLNKLLKLKLTQDQLLGYALQLGSDCPFFILNKPCFATGRGEKMEEISAPLDDHSFVLVDPGVHIGTAWAFEKISGKQSGNQQSLKGILALPVNQWKDQLINDFEAPVFEEYERLKIIKEELYAAGAQYASLTGTGSCIYGIFPPKASPLLHKISDRYKVYHLKQNR